MSESPAKRSRIWPKGRAIYIETVFIILLSIVSMALQYGRLDSHILFSLELWIRILGSLSIWFANKFTLDYMLQSRIESNTVSQFLPFEMTIASVAVTAIFYFVFYPILVYLQDWDFVWAKFLQGLFVTAGLSLLIVILYAGVHIWHSWWNDGEFLFRKKDGRQAEREWKDFITLENLKGSVQIDLKDVLYFISEFKIVFLVDASGTKRATQYNLAELEKGLDDRFFRLNRRILVARQSISHIKKLPNHRLLVTIGPQDSRLQEPVSRYRSTRFKQWLHGSRP
ncbi:LytTR family DNA-binding domain-containing protein [Robiginitalea sp. IMCC44478]|uniref:LytTR family DNA-binding domain-containing protein n=1 Tax=Robiginitalea sp. IMCC44478 TaxID=3459122 RepID=UPI004042CC10